MHPVMSKIEKILFSLVCIVLMHFDLNSQKLLEQQPEIRITYSDSDSARVHSFVGLPNPKISVVTYGRINEYFVLSDTLKRDYVLFGNSKVTIDKLQGLQQCDYTGAYDIFECRWVENRFLILSCVNTYFYGTNQNVFYAVFELKKNHWNYHSSYDNEADRPTDSIRVISSKKRLKLKGKYLKQSKRLGLDCSN